MERQTVPAAPCILVIFGAAGDLTKRLLMPALYNLRHGRLLPESFALIGIARGAKDEAAFRRDLGDGLREFATSDVVPEDSQWLAARMRYLAGDFSDPLLYKRLAKLLSET